MTTSCSAGLGEYVTAPSASDLHRWQQTEKELRAIVSHADQVSSRD
jgi:hypothetical protein